MSLKEKQEQLKEIQNKMGELYKALNPLQKAANNLRDEIRRLEFKSILPLTPEKVLVTNYQVFEEANSYKELQKYMRQFKFVQCDGYNPETELKALKIKLSQKEPVQNQLDEVTQFLPFVSKVDYEKIDKYGRITRPQELEGKIRVVSIFEHTCSEYGCYSMLVGENDMASLLIVRHYSPKIITTLPLAKMIEYIRDNHPYERSKEMEDCDE